MNVSNNSNNSRMPVEFFWIWSICVLILGAWLHTDIHSPRTVCKLFGEAYKVEVVYRGGCMFKSSDGFLMSIQEHTGYRALVEDKRGDNEE